MKKILFTMVALTFLNIYVMGQTMLVDFEDMTTVELYSEGYLATPEIIANPKSETGNTSANVLHVVKGSDLNSEMIKLTFATPMAPSDANKLSFMIWTMNAPANVWIKYGKIVEAEEVVLNERWATDATIDAGRWDTLAVDLTSTDAIDFIYLYVGYWENEASIYGDYYIDNIKFDKEVLVLTDPVKTINSMKVTTAPEIDGTDLDDDAWTDATWEKVEVVGEGTISNFSGQFKTCWDNTYLYILFKVMDGDANTLVNNQFWYNDGVEIYLDPRGKFIVGPRKVDYQHQLRINYGAPDGMTGWNEALVNTVYNANSVFADGGFSGGYYIEAKLPWASMFFWNNVVDLDSAAKEAAAVIKHNHIVGLDISILDATKTGATTTSREAVLNWTINSSNEGPYNTSSAFGALKLVDPNAGIFNPVQRTAFSVMPNPVTDQIYFDQNVFSQVQVINNLGQIVLEKEGMLRNINVTSLENGMYFINAYDRDGQLFVSKFLKQ